MKGTRLDVYMAAAGLAESREKARALIIAGEVTVDGRLAEKPGINVNEGQSVVIASNPIPFVSRGGLKLLKAIETFQIDLAGLVAIDIGASTGGFTDCMLQHGACKVYAVDVGYGQLNWTLRNDGRVIVMERRNARFMEPAWFDEHPAFASIDVSFISVKLILPALYTCLAQNASAVVLIKPQFEAGRELVGKNGVIRDMNTHIEVIKTVIGYANQAGFSALGLTYSPITGPKGNIEYLLYIQKNDNSGTAGAGNTILQDEINRIAMESHTFLS